MAGIIGIPGRLQSVQAAGFVGIRSYGYGSYGYGYGHRSLYAFAGYPGYGYGGWAARRVAIHRARWH